MKILLNDITTPSIKAIHLQEDTSDEEVKGPAHVMVDTEKQLGCSVLLFAAPFLFAIIIVISNSLIAQ